MPNRFGCARSLSTPQFDALCNAIAVALFCHAAAFGDPIRQLTASTRPFHDAFLNAAAPRIENDGVGGTAGQSPSAPVEPLRSVDVAVTTRLFDDKAQLAVGVLDLLDTTRDNAAQVGVFTSHETPGRTLYFRFLMEF